MLPWILPSDRWSSAPRGASPTPPRPDLRPHTERSACGLARPGTSPSPREPAYRPAQAAASPPTAVAAQPRFARQRAGRRPTLHCDGAAPRPPAARETRVPPLDASWAPGLRPHTRAPSARTSPTPVGAPPPRGGLPPRPARGRIALILGSVPPASLACRLRNVAGSASASRRGTRAPHISTCRPAVATEPLSTPPRSLRSSVV